MEQLTLTTHFKFKDGRKESIQYTHPDHEVLTEELAVEFVVKLGKFMGEAQNKPIEKSWIIRNGEFLAYALNVEEYNIILDYVAPQLNIQP